MAVLQSHDWPGNVRQLRNNIERLMILVGGDAESLITADMLPDEIISPVPLSPNGAGGEHLMSLPLARRAGDFRARVSAGAGQPIRRQYFPHGGVRWHGAVGAPPQTSRLGCQLHRARGGTPLALTMFSGELPNGNRIRALAVPALQSRLMWPASQEDVVGPSYKHKRGPKGRGSPWQQNARKICKTRFSITFASKDAADDIPRERREAAGGCYLVRQFLRAAPPRRPFATRLQARHLDHHAWSTDPADRVRRRRRCRRLVAPDRSESAEAQEAASGRGEEDRRLAAHPPRRSCSCRFSPGNAHRQGQRSGARALQRSPEARLEEALGLARAIDLEVRASGLVPLPRPRPATLFGSGKVAEIDGLIRAEGAELVIVDHR